MRIINYTPSRSVCGRNTTRLRGICRFLWLSSSSAFQQRSTRSLSARSPARLIANRRRLASKQRWRRTVVPEPWLVVLYRRRVGRLFDGLTTMYPALPSYYTYLPSLHLRIVRLLTRTDRDLREVRLAAYWTPALLPPSPPPLDRTKTSFTRSYSSGKLSGQ